MRIEQDFGKIAAGFEPLPADAYQCVVKTVEDGKTKDGSKDVVKIVLEVDDSAKPEFAGRQLFHNIVLQKNDGTMNPVALGNIKQYAIACLGDDAANGSAIDPADFRGSSVIAVVELRSWEERDPSGNVLKSGTNNEIKKVLPVK